MNENTMNNDVTMNNAVTMAGEGDRPREGEGERPREPLSMNNAVTMRPDRGASLGRIDQYELIRELGGGGFGCVYLARDTVAGIEVAVKGLPPLVRLNKEELENVRQNFALVSRLYHPNIAAALHFQKVQSAVYNDDDVKEKFRVFKDDPLVVMQYARGVTLSQWRKQFPDGKVPLDKAIEITRQIASALDYAHKERIIHRDIKPANVMIETLPDRSVTARVLDFGLAAEIRSSMGRLSLNVSDKSGTRHYMAPEQWSGKKQSKETDQYSLAALFYELILGEVPFASVFDTGDTVLMKTVVENDSPEIPSDLPKPIRRALAKGLAKEREDRFGSCIKFVDALVGRASGGRASVLAHGRASVPAHGRASVPASHARGLRAFIISAVAALGLAFGGVWYWQQGSSKSNMGEAREDARPPMSQSASKVQLWEGGPYWADRNIGAEKPEDPGYYFWWGDTVGYKREGDKWIASDGSASNFEFRDSNTPTSGKSVSDLRSEGWITADGVLSPQHDAAQKHWGGNWRMPTKMELDDLKSKCDWSWIQVNGVNGYLVRGKGEYTSKSIFLPCGGGGNGTSLLYAGLYGFYRSSVSDSGSFLYAWGLGFKSGDHYTYIEGRDAGVSVRPLQGFTK